MNVLLIGSGGREHALAWKLLQSEQVTALTCAPGNAGMAEIAACVDVAADDLVGLVGLAERGDYDFVIVGPEAPLAAGLVDILTKKGMRVFGPTQAAAQLESSKAFTKAFCERYNIPTADYAVFTELAAAKAHIKAGTPPFVIKADGLAAGKGVVIAPSEAEALAALEDYFSGMFGKAGETVIIEAFMSGQEASFFAIADGETAVPLIAAQDHKRAFDGDKGPNTGGMGAYSPAPVFDEAALKTVMETIIQPTVYGMKKEGHPFKGVLFAGLMMTEEGPKLIEYNARFGDPECQVLMRRLSSDVMDIFLAAEAGTLASLAPIGWFEEPVVNVVLAAKGYPGSYEKGSEIKGVDQANAMEGVSVFHAGTRRDDQGALCANGGRVLNVTASGETLDQAVERAYQAIDTAINWPEGFCRRDIAHHGLSGSEK